MTSGAHISFLQRFAPKTSIADRACKRCLKIQCKMPDHPPPPRGGVDRAM